MAVPRRKPDTTLVGPRFLLVSRGAAILFVVAFLALVAAGGWILSVSRDLADQQHQTTELVDQNTKLGTELCKLSTALALYQPDLDPQVIRTVNEIIGELPRKCFP